MTQTFLNLSAGLCMAAFLTACSSGDGANPVSGGTIATVGAEAVAGDDTNIEGIPDDLSSNLEGVGFDPNSQTLAISIGGLDADSTTSVYSRDASLDVPGFLAFTKQDDPLDRFFVAFADLSPDGTVQAFAVSDGGQFNRFFGGTVYSRIGTYSQPTSGLVSYAGKYAASSNIGELGTAQLQPVPSTLNQNVLPRQPLRVTGDVFINVDFSEDKINGEIYNRQLIRADGTVVLAGEVTMPNASLIATDIEADGTFTGTVEDSVTENSFGTYAGVFGGENASSVGGGVHLDRFTDSLENEEEYGAFALAKCGTPGDAAICDDL